MSTTALDFHFDNHPVRIFDRDGAPWFVAADVCAVLGIANHRDACLKLDPDEKDDVGLTDAIGRSQKTSIISESGLWTLVLRCREATTPGSAPYRLRKWVTSEVLPTIRKTGGYGDQMAALNDPVVLRNLLMKYSEGMEAMRGRLEEMGPKVQALDRLADTEGTFCITDAAKTLQVTPKLLFRFLREHRWIYTRANTTHEVAYQDKLVSGYLEHKTTTVYRSDGSEKTATQVRVTAKGLAKLAVLLGAPPPASIPSPPSQPHLM